MNMEEKLTWEEIEKRYWHQWVQLVDFDWPDTQPWPNTAVVRVHAPSREQFDELAAKDPPDKSARLFLDGIPTLYRISEEEANARLNGSK